MPPEYRTLCDVFQVAKPLNSPAISTSFGTIVTDETGDEVPELFSGLEAFFLETTHHDAQPTDEDKALSDPSTLAIKDRSRCALNRPCQEGGSR